MFSSLANLTDNIVLDKETTFLQGREQVDISESANENLKRPCSLEASKDSSWATLLHASKKQHSAAPNSSKENSSVSALSIEDVPPLLSGKVSYSECPARVSNDYNAPIVPGELDILCGRHKEAYSHFGNKVFRSIVTHHRTEYQGAKSREEKSKITEAIINCIYQGQGRFLKQDDETKLWHNVTKDYVYEKVSHALRSAKDPKAKRGRKKRVTSKKYTVEEDAAFVFLLTEQQKSFQGLLNDETPSEAESALVDEVPNSIAVMNGCGHPWTTEEDSILRSKCALGRLSWAETAAFLPGRSPDQCCSRFESLSRQSKSVVAEPSNLGAAYKRRETAPTKQAEEVANAMTVFGTKVETWTSEEDKSLQRNQQQNVSDGNSVQDDTQVAKSALETLPPSWNSSKRVKTSLLGDDNVESYNDIHPHFVMCGRGERVNRHPGNKAYRRLVVANQPQYHSAPRRNKILIAESIVQAVYHQVPPGRFVRFDKESELWIDIGTKAAIKKTSQALREDSQKDKSTSEESSKKDDYNESSNRDEDGEDEDERKLPARPSPSSRNSERGNNLHARQHGFGIVPGAVSFHSLEQREGEDNRQQRVVSGGHSSSRDDQAAHVSPIEELLQMEHRGGHEVSYGNCPEESKYQAAVEMAPVHAQETPKNSNSSAFIGNLALFGAAIEQTQEKSNESFVPVEASTEQSRVASISHTITPHEQRQADATSSRSIRSPERNLDLLADVSSAIHRLRPAGQDLPNALQEDPAEFHTRKGLELFETGDFKEAIIELEKALEVLCLNAPTSMGEAECLFNIGCALMLGFGTAFNEQGDYEGALRSFRQAMVIYEKIETPTSLQLEKLRLLINSLSADGSNSGKKNTETPVISPPHLAINAPAAVPFDGPGSEQHTSAAQVQSLNGRTAEPGSLPSSTVGTSELDTRKCRRKRLLPAKFSGDNFVLDQKTKFLQEREEVDISESANENRKRPCSVEASKDSSWGTPLHVPKKHRSADLNTSRDNSSVSANAVPSIPRVAQPKWTAEEDKLLLEKRALGLDWSQIAEHLPARNANGCKARVTKLGRTAPILKSTRAAWTEQEDAILMEKHALGLDWMQIAKHLPNRNEGGCRQRYNALRASSRGDEAAVSRGENELVPVKTAREATSRIKTRPLWTEQEDTILMEKHALGLDWMEIAKHLPNRNDGDCRIRCNALRASSRGEKAAVSRGDDELVQKGQWTLAEDATLQQKRVRHARWDSIAASPPSRTADACQQHYRDAQFSRRKNGSSRPRWTEEDIRLVKESYLTSFPQW